jgi:hypothetical protein
VDALIESVSVPDNAVYGEIDVLAAGARPALKVDFIDLKLIYESFTPDSRSLAGFSRATPRYFVDKPYFYYASVPPGIMVTRHDFKVEPGTKAVVMGFAHGHQLWHNPEARRHPNARIRFIPNSTMFRLKLDHKDDFIFTEGLKDPGVAAANQSSGCKTYHLSLVRKGLTDRPFDKTFPRKFATVKGYEQHLLLDLTDLTFDKESTLTATTTYNNTLSPANWFFFAFGLQQYQLTHLANSKWKRELVK